GKKASPSKAAAAGSCPYDLFTLLHGLHTSAPQLLLPVIPELKAQLRQDDEHRRAAAAALLTRLLAAPPVAAAEAHQHPPPPPQSHSLPVSSMGGGSTPAHAGVGAAGGGAAVVPLAAQYPELMQDLLQRFTDQSPVIRQQMLARTAQLAEAAAIANPDGSLEHQVLSAARDRLQDIDERVRAAACRAICVLAAAAATGIGAAGAAAAAAAGAAAGGVRSHHRRRSLEEAPAGLPMSSQQPHSQQLGGPALYDNELVAVVRQDVAARLRDRKIAVRREAVVGLLAAWRDACMALVQGCLSLPGLVRSVGWVPARLCSEAVKDVELRPHVMAALAAAGGAAQQQQGAAGGAAGGVRGGAGLLPSAMGQQLGAAVWAALWQSYDTADRTAVRKLLALKAQVALELQQLVELRGLLRAAAAG
ncbi:hypothetical protein Agub_g309, partial [Astrephomene gubernaculifera]